MRIARWLQGSFVGALVLGAPLVALGEEVESTVNAADTAWMMMSTGLVLLMTPGLAFFYGGLVRRKNVLSVLMQCFMCMSLMTVLWALVGYSLAFGDDMMGGFVGNFKYALLNGVGYEAKEGLTIPHMLFMAYQGMFAIITPGLIIGAFAERMKFGGFCLFSGLWLLLVYAPVCHWVWGGASGDSFWGMGANGTLDFAGGIVVHVNAGVAALVAALMLGKRQGYPSKTSPPHNLPFAVLGAGLLWFGWFGFNGGSALGANGQAVNAIVATHFSAAIAGLVWATIEWVRVGKPTCLGMITGAVAGLAGITPAAGYVTPMDALLIGIVASIVAYIFVAIIKEKLGYDDSLDVFGVHGMACVWGTFAVALWATDATPGNDANGLFYGSSELVWPQIKGILVTAVYSGVASWALLKLVDVTVGVKAGDHDERVGLDLTEHAEHAYTLLD